MREIVFLFMFSFVLQLPAQNVLVLDAGHGGQDSGSNAYHDSEADLSLDFVKSLEHYLKKYTSESNLQVKLTRNDDSFIQLQNRVDYISENKAKFAISFHFSESENPNNTGIEIYVQDKFQAENAIITSYLNDAFKHFNYTIKEVESTQLYLLKNSPVPTVLVNLGYTSNPSDMQVFENQKEELAMVMAKFIAELNYQL